MAICCLSNLFATTETVGNNQRIFTCTAHSGKQHPFTDLDRHVVVVFFKPEGSSHTTTTRVEYCIVKAQIRKHRLFIPHPHDCLVMAMPMHQGPALKLRELVMLRLFFKKFAEKECLLAEPLCIFVIGKKINQFITEDRNTTRLQANHGHTLLYLRLQRIEYIPQQAPGSVEHAIVIEWTAAAQCLLWHLNLVPCCFKHFHRRDGCLWVEVIVERVGPENY